MAKHPLDPLTLEEFNTAVAVLKKHFGPNRIRFITVLEKSPLSFSHTDILSLSFLSFQQVQLHEPKGLDVSKRKSDGRVRFLLPHEFQGVKLAREAFIVLLDQRGKCLEAIVRVDARTISSPSFFPFLFAEKNVISLQKTRK
jgi:hypothetical protein